MYTGMFTNRIPKTLAYTSGGMVSNKYRLQWGEKVDEIVTGLTAAARERIKRFVFRTIQLTKNSTVKLNPLPDNSVKQSNT